MLRRLLLAAALAGCGTSETTTPAATGDGGPDSSGGPPVADSGTDDGSDAGAGDGSTCAVTRAFVERCNGELTCGADKFDGWCEANDKAINSDAYRRAEKKCLPTSECTKTARDRCEYESLAGETPTDAQRALVDAFCKTCEPSDVAGCTSRSIAYDPKAGEVTDIFIAAWELADDVCDAIRTQCTGPALDVDGGDCAAAFSSCASGPYLDAVPDCP